MTSYQDQKKELNRQISQEKEQLKNMPRTEATKNMRQNIKKNILNKKNQKMDIQKKQNDEKIKQLNNNPTLNTINEVCNALSLIDPHKFSTSSKKLGEALALSENYFHTCRSKNITPSDDIIDRIITLLQKYQSEVFEISRSRNIVLDYGKAIQLLSHLIFRLEAQKKGG